MSDDKARLLRKLRLLCEPYAWQPSIADILTAIEQDSVRQASQAVLLALRNPRVRGTALHVALADWGGELNRLRKLAIAQREDAA